MKVCNEEIKERIIQTTRDFLKKYGLKGWNMDLLACETGLAKNTLYKIIGSKENLLEQTVLSKIKHDLAQIGLIIHEETDYEKAIHKMTERFADLVKNNFDYVIPTIFLEYPAIEAKVISSREEIYASLYSFISTGMENGLIRDDVTPEFIVDLIKGVVLHYFRSGLTGDRFEMAFQCAMDCLVNGLMKRDNYCSDVGVSLERTYRAG